MEKTLSRVPVFLLLVLLLFQSCRTTKYSEGDKPIRWNGQGNPKWTPYKKNEIIVFYKHKPSPAEVQSIKNAITAQGITVTAMQVCSKCDSYMELWKGINIHTVIHTEGVSGGSGGGGSRGVGEDSLARYSLNYTSAVPVDNTPQWRDSINVKYRPDKKMELDGTNKDTVTIAVLDTGIDTANFISKKLLWKNPEEKENMADDDNNCLDDDINGWNFIGGNRNIHDDNNSLHGTLVSSYIIDEFRSTSKNFVQIMSLKTHDSHGYGDLFSTICAIHYAVGKGAKIINASWGFYYYDESPHPYLDSLITDIVKKKGVLFITAAGNKIPDEDIVARQIYRDSFGVILSDHALRNLEIHNFYPACFSRDDNNVITVTTTDGSTTSPTQNFSSKFVDLGIKADRTDPTHMKFLEPFTLAPVYISGSSFATAIATGKLGAWLPKSVYHPDIKKEEVFDELNRLISTGSISPDILIRSAPLESNRLIRKGRYSHRK